ncbi:MAG: VTT domain-containing protein [Bacteroidales bacterium]|nr:VTT domain-containing protein [Bacteroidales bacterium]
MTNNRSDDQVSRSGSRMKKLFIFYKERGLFRYVGRNVLMIIVLYVIFIFLVFLIGKYLIDFNRLFHGLFNTLSDRFVIILFFASESFMGLVPVDLFVIWTQKFEKPVPYLALLGILSYVGGVISYQIGRWISRWPKIKAYTEKKLSNYIDFVRKWGGAFIIFAALFPFTPFSLVVISVTMLKYPFKQFLLFALARIVRFVIQGVLFFDILNMDRWVI